MEDEDAFFHLPSGKAAVIATDTLQARDGAEEKLDEDYRAWKDAERKRLVDDPRSAFHRNLNGYVDGWMPFYKTGFEGWAYHHAEVEGKSDITLIFPLCEPTPNWLPSLRLACDHAQPALENILLVVPENLPLAEWEHKPVDRVNILRISGSTDRNSLIHQAALCAQTTWCAVLEPGLVPAPGWNHELVEAALRSQASQIQGNIWNNRQIIQQPRPWPWFFLCKTELLQPQMTGMTSFMDFPTPARLLPGVQLHS